MTDERPRLRFYQTLAQELLSIRKARGETPNQGVDSSNSSESEVYKEAEDAGLAGIAFSGGGIRSATFNLGVIQAFSKKQRLHKFDYLSTVSGGGYIGSWMSALFHRNKKDDVDAKFVKEFQNRLTTHPCAVGSDCSETSGYRKPNSSGFPPVEHAAVRYLRGYSNYLTPRLGLSGDVLALISLFLRNVILVQIVLAVMIAFVLLVPYIVNSMSHFVISKPGELPFKVSTVAIIGVVFQLVGLWFCGVLLNRGKRTLEDDLQREADDHEDHAASKVVIGILLPAFFGAWLVTIAMASSAGFDEHIQSRAAWVGYGALIFSGIWAVAFIYSRVRIRHTKQAEGEQETLLLISGPGGLQPLISHKTVRLVAWLLGAAAVAGALFGFLLFEGASFASTFRSGHTERTQEIVAFGPPLFLLALSLVEAIHIGASRNCFDEHDREWWARLGGFVLLGTAVWTVLFSLVLYAPPIIYWLGNGGFAVAVAWLGGSAAGAAAARRGNVLSEAASKFGGKLLVRFAPWLFLIGLVGLLSFLVFLSLLLFAGLSIDWTGTEKTLVEAIHWTTAQESELKLRHPFLLAIGAGVVAFVATRVFDINIFSAHSLYKNRLVRAYLGACATGQRHAHPFTGFDSKDDVALKDLAGQRPVHILNTTINMTGGDDLAWQTRRAASFSITPYFAGYEAKSTQGQDLGSYRPISEYAGGMTLGTALAISGAAASPNMGYHTAPSIAALLTAFNLRLGYWAGNPKDEETWKRSGPKYAMRPILLELMGSARANSPWINLTDGGHFDNLGVYELVRRRCRLIIVTDAGCDPNHEFEDLANSIRKCWTDFGVNIVMRGLQKLRLSGSDRKYSQVQSACGEIYYPGNTPRGRIIYIKNSLTREIRDNIPDIGQYADSHATFPHESTVDQFFDESQFEAYRHLGYEAGEGALIRFKDEINRALSDSEGDANNDRD